MITLSPSCSACRLTSSTVDLHAVGAVEILDHALVRVGQQHGVMPADEAGVDLDVIVRRAADGRALAQREHHFGAVDLADEDALDRFRVRGHDAQHRSRTGVVARQPFDVLLQVAQQRRIGMGLGFKAVDVFFRHVQVMLHLADFRGRQVQLRLQHLVELLLRRQRRLVFLMRGLRAVQRCLQRRHAMFGRNSRRTDFHLQLRIARFHCRNHALRAAP